MMQLINIHALLYKWMCVCVFVCVVYRLYSIY